MTNFKETEIGDIPINWKVVRLGDVITFTKKPKTVNRTDYETLPFIPMNLITSNEIFIQDYEERDISQLKHRIYCEKGDILLPKISPSFQNGKQGIVGGTIPFDFAYATTEVFALKAKSNQLDQLFLFHLLKSPHLRNALAGKMKGATGRQRIPRSVIQNYLIPLPPLEAQYKVATILNIIQQAIMAQENVISAMQAVKRSLSTHLFCYGPEKQPAPTVESPIGLLPKHWQVVKLNDVLESSAFGPRFSKDCYDETGGIGALRISDIDKNGLINYSTMPRVTLTEAKFKKHFLKKGDFLVTRSGTCGIAAVFDSYHIPVLVGSFIIKFTLLNRLMNPLFLREYFNSPLGRNRVLSLALGAVQKNISGTALKKFQIPCPPLSEQLKISSILQTVDTKIAVEQDRQKTLQALFNSLLNDLTSGQLNVNHLSLG